MFVIRPGIYNVPELRKRIDTRTKLSNEQLLELCLSKSFSPFISITAKAIPFLKKQKLSQKQVVSLIMCVKTIEEVNFLLEVKTSKTIKSIAETKLKSLEN